MSKVDDFVTKVKDGDPRNDGDNVALNKEWATIKATLPEGDKAAGETKVREVLKA